MGIINLGDVVPNFSADTNEGPIKFHEWISSPAGSWSILFSHPADFTPVCTTELGTVALIQEEFTKRNCKVIALSCNDVTSHQGWIEDIKVTQKVAEFGYPIIADPTRDIAVAWGMVDPDEKDAAGLPMACRAVFIIGPDKKLKLKLLYPASTGRNFAEIVRVLDSLQLTANYSVATPADWSNGEPCMVLPSVSVSDARSKFPQHQVMATPSGKPYLRITPQPSGPAFAGQPGGTKPKIGILYYSMYGHIRQMALAVKNGLEAAGCTGVLLQIPETLPAEVLAKMGAPPKADDPVATVAELPDYDGFMFGIPGRFGMMPAQIKTFWDATGSLWQSGKLIGKPAGVFVSTGTQGGGQETIGFTFVSQLAHHGMNFVSLGYRDPKVFDYSQAHGASPYGSGCLAGPDGSREPSQLELDVAETQGRSFGEIAAKLKA